jgi:hypothetical protein
LSRLSLPLAGEEREIPLYQSDIEKDLQLVSRNKLAEKITGGLSWPSKMPCPAIGISAYRCKIGSVLAEKEGTTCSECYSRKGHYLFPNVQNKLEERYEGLFHPLWVPSLVFLIRWNAGRYFRLFDSGDVQSVNHMKNICTVARNVPDVSMWMPSREAEIVRACKDDIPPTLTVRLSATMVDGKPPRNWQTTSTVVSDPEKATCPAPQQGGKCGECRKCWDRDEKNIAYALH